MTARCRRLFLVVVAAATTGHLRGGGAVAAGGGFVVAHRGLAAAARTGGGVADRALTAEGRQSEAPPGMWWVHTPKTGSSFCLTLQHVWCRDRWPGTASPEAIYDRRGCTHVADFTCHEVGVGHGPVPAAWPDAAVRRAVIVVRDPFDRIVSSFSDGKHHVRFPPSRSGVETPTAYRRTWARSTSRTCSTRP